ncbi:MAG: cold-shock protein [Calditrichaceae bacterium]
MADRQTGTVKWFDAKKGYGFISTDNGEDIFVHYTAIQTEGFKTLEESQKVEFTVVDGNKGPVASDLVLIS